MKDIKVTDKRCLELSRIVLEGIPGIKFDMEMFMDHCGTAACLAGYAVHKYAPELWEARKCRNAGGPNRAVLASDGSVMEYNFEYVAADLLGLSEARAEEMFYPWSAEGLRRDGKYAPAASDITPEMAARMLTHFVATRRVVWEPQS